MPLLGTTTAGSGYAHSTHCENIQSKFHLYTHARSALPNLICDAGRGVVVYVNNNGSHKVMTWLQTLGMTVKYLLDTHIAFSLS